MSPDLVDDALNMKLLNKNKDGKSYTIVIKLGSSSIIHESTHQPLLALLSSIVETVVELRKNGHKVVLVSSGAIAVGLKRMELDTRPEGLSAKQALAAIGQGRLIALWDNLFGQLGQTIAQILLTRGDISDKTRYLNAGNTLSELLSLGVVPIVNENDTVSVSEIRFGDNDSLSAITASMINADFLFLLTDVDGLYNTNPRKDTSAKRIDEVESVAEIRSRVSTKTLGSSLGTGGMETKLIAADIATAAGVTTVIASSQNPKAVFDIIKWNAQQSLNPTASSIPRPPHTCFKPSALPLGSLKSWIFHTLHPYGSVVIDHGAHVVLCRRDSGGRLLPPGVLGVIGTFAAGQAVRIMVRKQPVGQEHHDNLLVASPAFNSIPSTPTLSNEGSPEKLFEDTNGHLHAPNESFVSPNNEAISEDDLIEVGRGLANYNSVEIAKVQGRQSALIAKVLGYADSEYVVENITIRVRP